MGRRRKPTYGIDPEVLAKIEAASEIGRARSAARVLSVRRRNQKKMTAWHKAKAEARVAAKAAERTPGVRRVRLLALPGAQVLAARMVEGVWYTAKRDLVALVPEYAARGVAVFVAQALAAGSIERALNADYDRTRAPGRQMEPRYLYRLSVEGVESAVEWRKVLGEGVER